jgi:TetR/AcrR family transcriptional regulator, transcriptional repressor of aconitase
MSLRLEAAERRAAIVRAALPLFARKGFATITTKEIAAAAGVSEALIFKHFPSKAALYDAIVRSGCEGSEELEALARGEPSTALLVELMRCMMHFFVVEVPADQDQWKARHRLLLSSLLEDGEFARRAYGWVRETLLPIFTASLAAAEAAGDVVASPVSPENRFFFAEHFASMLASTRLPAGQAVAGGAGEP